MKRGRTIWRDAKGRITETGALRAVTATCNGKKWDVSGDMPKRIRKKK